MHSINANVHVSGAWLLAIDTSSEQVGLALTDGAAMAEVTWPAGRQQSMVLMGAIASLLDRVRLSKSDLGAIGVAVGPGTFNGLRAGIGTAKGLALGAGLPVVAVGTLAATVWPVLAPGRVAVGVAAAGRGRVVSARFRSPGSGSTDGPDALGDPTNGTVTDLAAMVRDIAEPVTVAGELTPAQVSELRAALAGWDVWFPSAGGVRRPAAIADLALARWRLGRTADLAALDAVYLHGVSRPAGRDRPIGQPTGQ